ncbi:MAG TPA: glycosyltransferase family 2 protein [Chthoniobacterales bacterium]
MNATPKSCFPLSGADITTPATGRACEISIVIPCLNESETVGICVRKAVEWLRNNGVAGEVIVADNGSTDGSREIAAGEGARVLRVAEKGYGSALMGGISAAKGRLVIMGDADDSYDFSDLGRFVEKLRAGYDLVQGCRLPSGGGTVMPHAMPPLHRWWGNPMFSVLARVWFRAPINDIYCGLRGFTKELHARLDQRCTGMEFATEMIIKASLRGEKIAEVPITLHPDGRKTHKPHLKTFRDGWRTLRFFLLFSPRWLFLLPGIGLVLAGLVASGLALAHARVGNISFDAHTLLFGSLAILCGWQSIEFAVFTKIFAITEGLLPRDKRLEKAFGWINLEKALIAGVAASVAGVALLAFAILLWSRTGFGRFDYSEGMRIVIPGATLTALGFQTMLSSFFISILGMRRK